MRWPDWISNALRTPSPRRKHRRLSNAERRKRDEQFIPLHVGRLEDRRVLSAPALNGVHNLTPVVNSTLATNTPTLVSSLISGEVTANGASGPFGVAVVGISTSATVGSWRYSTDGGAHWTTLTSGAPSKTSATLLAPSSLIEFVPAAGVSGTVSNGLSLIVWDTSTGSTHGNAGDLADTTAGKDLTTNATGLLFSDPNSPQAPSVQVLPPLTISGTTSASITDKQTATPFSAVNFTDNVSATESDTVTITESGTAQGTLSGLGADFTQVTSTEWQFHGTAANASAELQSAVFTPLAHQVTPGNSVAADFSLAITNGTDSASDSATVVNVTATNTAPSLGSSTGNAFTAILANNTTSGGTSVSALISGHVTDPDSGQTEGIAVTAVDNTNGFWQYTLNGGTTWLYFGTNTTTAPGSHSVTSLSTAALLLLPADNIRFVPTMNFSGTASITFRAWDGFTGGVGTTANLTGGGATGGSTAYSSTTATSSILVNTAPTLSGANNLPTIPASVTPADDTGVQVSTLISGQASDTPGSSLGIAVTAVDDANGFWEYSLDGSNWFYFVNPTGANPDPYNSATDNSNAALGDSAAVLLAPADYLRFVPNASFAGTSSGLTFRAWDQTSGTAGGTADTTSNGGTTAFSTNTQTASIQVGAPPTISGTVANQTTDDHTAIDPFSGVTIGDPNTPALTNITVTVSLSAAANGTLSGAGFTETSAGSGVYTFTGTAAAATADLDELAFAPTEHQAASGTVEITTFTISADDHVNPLVSDTTTSVNVTERNDAPTLNNSKTLASFPSLLATNTSSSGETVATLLGSGQADVDFDPQQGIAIVDSTVSGPGGGVWQYSTDGTNWEAIGSVSADNALLLVPTDSVRFLPDGTGGNAGSITFRAWDQTQGTAATTLSPNYFDITSFGGSSAFSSGSATTTITAIGAPTITGTVADQATDDTAPINPFSMATIGDPNATPQTLTVTITLLKSDDTTAAKDANGKLSEGPGIIGGFTESGTSGVYTMTGTAATITTDLRALIFTPTLHQARPGMVITTFFKLSVTNGINPTVTDNTTSVDVTESNTAPTLIPANVVGPTSPIPDSDTTNATDPGITVATLLNLSASPSHRAVTDPNSGTTDGIAIDGLTVTGSGTGVWQYSTDGTTWTNIEPTVSDANALLLTDTDSIRFLPDGTNNNTATLTFRAWDETQGTVDTYFAIPVDGSGHPIVGGHSAFSTLTDTVSVTALAAPTISGTLAGQTTDDHTAIDPFSGVTIGDPNSPPLTDITVTVTLSASANGTLSEPGTITGGFTAVPGTPGEYTFTGSAATAKMDLDALIFTPTDHQVAVGSSVTTTFTITADNTVNSVVSDNTTTVIVTARNDAPVLSSTGFLNPMTAILASNTDPTGTQVSTLLGTADSDVDHTPQKGIAIDGLTVSGPGTGTWQYSTDATTWVNIDPSTISDANALLLTASDYIRFVPDGTNGTSATISFRAWDQTQGSPESFFDITTGGGTGGTTAFSTRADTSSIHAIGVPTISGTVANQATTDEATIDPFSGVTVADQDTTTQMVKVTIALQDSTGASVGDTNGLLSGTGFTETAAGSGIYTMTDTPTAVTTALDALVFTPKAHQVVPGNTVTTFFKITVANTNTASNPAIPSATDSTTSVVATAVHDAPTLAATGFLSPLPAILASNTSEAPTQVSTLLGTAESDPDVGALSGIAVIGATVDGPGGGLWEYSTDGSTWTPIATGGVSDSNALLLTSSDYIRFVPDGVNGTSGTLSFRAWDQTEGTAAAAGLPNYFNITATGGNSAFSATADTTSIHAIGLPTISGTVANQTTNDVTSLNPFAGVTVGDVDTTTQFVKLDVTVSDTTNGRFTAASLTGWTSLGGGKYELGGASSVTAAQATTALQALVFQPTAHQVNPGDTVTTGFTLKVANTNTASVPAIPSVTDTTTSVIVTAVHDAPVVPTQNFLLPVGSADGMVVGTLTATTVDHFSAGTFPTITYAIDPATNPGGAFALVADPHSPAAGAGINKVDIVLVNSAALTGAMSVPLTIVATDNLPSSLSSTQTGNTGIYVWQLTASATPIGPTGATTVTATISIPGGAAAGLKQYTNLAVNYDDGSTDTLANPPAAPVEHAFNEHFFIKNPGPTAASPIPITVSVTDAQGHTATIVTEATVDGTGIFGGAVIAQPTSAAVLLTPTIVLTPIAQQAAVDASTGQQGDSGVAPSEVTAGEGRQVMLRIVSPDGHEGSDIQVLGPAQNDLPGMFKKLPDGHYRVYLSEDGRTRLMMDVVVRGGRPSDPAQESSGGEDRPPSSQIEYHPPALVANKAIAGKQSSPLSGGATNSVDGAKDQSKAELPVPAAPQPLPPSTPPAPGPKTGDGAEFRRHVRTGVNQAALELVAAGVGLAAVGLESQPQQIDRVMARLGKRSLSKAARLGRRLRGAVGRSPK